MNTTLVVKKARTENKQTAKCFTCGAEISFKNKDGKTEYVKNRFGKSVVKRFNLDGSFHVCEKRQEKAQEQSSQQQESEQNKQYRGSDRSNSYWAWYWGFGPGKYHKSNYKRYSNDDYQQRRKAAEEQRQKWREQYSNKSTESMSHLEALRTLGLTVETLSKNFEEKLKQIKQAYRTLALKFHPDRVAESQKKTAHEIFCKINAAYELLTK